MSGCEENILQAWAVAREKEAELLELLENRITETAQIRTEHIGHGPECGLLQPWAEVREKELQLLELLENRIKETYQSNHFQLRTASSDMYKGSLASLNGDILTVKPQTKLWRSTILPAKSDISDTQQSILKVSNLRPTAEPFVMPVKSSASKWTVGFVPSTPPVSQPSSATDGLSTSPDPGTSLVSSPFSAHATSCVSMTSSHLLPPATFLVCSSSSNVLPPATSLLPQLQNMCFSKGWTLYCKLSGGVQARRFHMKVQDASGSVMHSSWGVGGSIREAQGVAARAMGLLFNQYHYNFPALEGAKEEGHLGHSVTVGRSLLC